MANYVFNYRHCYIVTVATRTEQIDRFKMRQFSIPARVSIRRNDFDQYRFSHQEHDHLPSETDSAGTWTAHHLHTPAPHQQNIILFCRHPPSTGEQQQNGGSHQPASHRPSSTSFAINKRSPGVTPAPVAFSSWWAARSAVSAICVTGMTSWLMQSALESTNQRTSSLRSGTLLVKQATQPGPGPVLINQPSTCNSVGLLPGPTTASRSLPNSPSVGNHSINIQIQRGKRDSLSNNQCKGALLFNIVSKLTSTHTSAEMLVVNFERQHAPARWLSVTSS